MGLHRLDHCQEVSAGCLPLISALQRVLSATFGWRFFLASHSAPAMPSSKPLHIQTLASLLFGASCFYMGGLASHWLFALWTLGLLWAAWCGPQAWLRRARASFSLRIHTTAVVVYAVGLVVATAIHPLPAIASELLFSLGLLPLAYFLSRAALHSGYKWQQLWLSLRWIAALIAVATIIERLLTHSRAYALLSDPNVLSGLLNAFILTGFTRFCRSLQQYYQNPLPAYQEGSLLLLMGAAMGCTGSLSGLLCLVSTLLPLAVCLSFKTARINKLVTLMIAVLTLTTVVLCSRGTAETPTEKLGGISQHSSFTVRLEMAQTSLAIYRAHAWYGSGLGTYKLYYPQYRGPLDTGTSGDLAHNDYIQFLQEGGPLLLGGLLLILLVVLLDLYRLIFGVWRQGLTPSRMFRLGICAALSALLMQAGMNFIFYVAPLSFLFGVLLAGAAPAAQPEAPAEDGERHLLGFAAVILAAGLSITATLGARGLFIELSHNTCNWHACRQLRSDQAFMQKLTSYLIGTQPTWIAARDYLVSNNIAGEMQATQPEIKARWRQQAWDESLELVQLIPEVPSSYVNLAEMLQRDPALASRVPVGLPNTPEGMLQQALRYLPQHLPTRLRLARMLIDQKRLAEAHQVLFADGMRYWKMFDWGDAGRMQMLTLAIPVAAELHHCTAAHEMSEGLAVFMKLKAEAEARGELLPASPGDIQPVPLAEAQKSMEAAKACIPAA